MKTVIGIVVVIIGLIAFFVWSPEDSSTTNTQTGTTTGQNDQSNLQGERTAPADGTYVVQAEESRVKWAGKKPLIDGYINSGSIAVTEGVIEIDGESGTGVFTIDMDTLSVSETPTKPGSENALEGHLKGERWFNVEAYPQATFAITKVTPRSDVAFQYDITGELTMKGETGEVMFPATVYVRENGTLYADAEFEIDRTKWGVTSGSGSFFDNLADNVIDDMVALSFSLVARK